MSPRTPRLLGYGLLVGGLVATTTSGGSLQLSSVGGGLLLGGGLYWLVTRWGPTAPPRGVERGPTQVSPGDLAAILTGVGILIAVLILTAGGITHETSVVVTDTTVEHGQTIGVGEVLTQPVTYPLPHKTPVLTTVVTADGAAVGAMTRESGSVTAQLRYGPYADVGQRTSTVTIARYPATLPAPFIRWLQQIHPSVAAIGTVLPVGVVQYLLLSLLARRMPPLRVRQGTLLAWGRRRRRRRQR